MGDFGFNAGDELGDDRFISISVIELETEDAYAVLVGVTRKGKLWTRQVRRDSEWSEL